MNKKFISSVIACTLCVSNFTFVCAKEINISKICPNSINVSQEKNKNLRNLPEIHQYLAGNSLLDTKEDGTIIIKADAYKLSISNELFDKYKKSIDAGNYLITNCGLEVDKNFKLNFTEKSYQFNKTSIKDNKVDSVDGMSLKGAKSVNILGTIHSNVNFLDGIKKKGEQYKQVDPTYDSMAAVRAIWISKVREGGDWDYKRYYGWDSDLKVSVPGYRKSIIKGEDFGNIHYGYTGKHIGYPDYVLLQAGGFIQIVCGNSHFKYYKSYFDDPNDTAAVKDGISWFKAGR